MSETTPNLDLKLIHRLLREIEHHARHASMANMRRSGTPILVDTYNRCLATLTSQGDEQVGLLFQPLSRETAPVDEVGASAALLASYVEAKVTPGAGRRRGPHMGHPGHIPDLFDEPDDEEDRG